VLVEPPAHPETAARVDPVSTPTAGIAPLPDAARPVPEVPGDLARLARRAPTDRASALALVHLLLERHWSADDVAATVALERRQIDALASVRRPRTSASDVADRLVAARRERRPRSVPDLPAAPPTDLPRPRPA